MWSSAPRCCSKVSQLEISQHTLCTAAEQVGQRHLLPPTYSLQWTGPHTVMRHNPPSYSLHMTSPHTVMKHPPFRQVNSRSLSSGQWSYHMTMPQDQDIQGHITWKLILWVGCGTPSTACTLQGPHFSLLLKMEGTVTASLAGLLVILLLGNHPGMYSPFLPVNINFPK